MRIYLALKLLKSCAVISNKLQLGWIFFSLVAVITGQLAPGFLPESDIRFVLIFYGQLSLLLAVGYYCTPSNSIFGKILFGFVVIMVIGIAFKILHYEGADLIIILSLLGIVGCYLWRWIKESRVF